MVFGLQHLTLTNAEFRQFAFMSTKLKSVEIIGTKTHLVRDWCKLLELKLSKYFAIHHYTILLLHHHVMQSLIIQNHCF